mgnify:CR=1 FL=1
MKLKKQIIGAAACLVLSGCATSTANYTPPKEHSVVNTKSINKPFDTVWDSLVRELSSDFFVINNIDKNSRLINISFSSMRPSEFVDCGSTSRTFTNARGEQSYNYQTADSSNFTFTNNQSHAFNVKRTTKLEGRTNIYVAPEGSGTNVTVNTKYVITVNTLATTFDGRLAGNDTFVFDPSTKQGFSNGEIKCFATGVIEARILRAAQ